MNQVKVSVIIITYNHFNYVRQAIESVLNQDIQFPIEIIIADDRSTDHTPLILEEYGEKHPYLISLILRDVNVGTTRNLCDAFKKCRGEYLIAFAGDDFWIDEKKLQMQVDWMETHTEYVGVSHVVESRDNAGIKLGRFPDARLWGRTVTSETYLKGLYFSTASTLFRNIFRNRDAEAYINLITRSRLVEDVSLAMLLLDTGKIYVMDRCMSVYRKNLNAGDLNYNSVRNPVQSFMDHVEIYKANENYFGDKYDFSGLYASKSAYPFFWSIKNRKAKSFFDVFSRMPARARLISLASFPVFFVRTILEKISASFSGNTYRSFKVIS